MEQKSHFILTIDTKQPVELADFIGQVTGFGNQFDKYIRQNQPNLHGDAKFYITDVRHGSFIIEILPIFQTLIEHIQDVHILDEFVTTWAARIKKYFAEGGRDRSASKTDIKDFFGTVRAIARDPEASSQLDFVAYEDGRRQQRAVLAFSSGEAREAVEQLEQHRYELEQVDAVDHSRVTMVFVRPDISDATLGRRSGERVTIEAISPNPRPLIYASELAEQRIKGELRTSEGNIFKVAFVVDVNVEMRNDRPWAYRVTHVHQIIPLEDD